MKRGSCVLDLSALRSNYRAFQTLLPAAAEMIAVVKWDCYGLGRKAILKALWDEGCRIFFCSRHYDSLDCLEELKEITNDSPDFRIITTLWSVRDLKTFFQELVDSRFVVSLRGEEDLQAALEFKRKDQFHFVIDLKFPGAIRAGFLPEKIKEYWAEIKQNLNVMYLSCYAASSSKPDSSGFKQDLKMMKIYSELFTEAKKSFSCTSALLMLDHLRLSKINSYGRLGGGLYGVQQVLTDKLITKPVVKKLSVPISYMHTSGTSVSLAAYIDQIPGGFDLVRANGHVFINGKKCKVLGPLQNRPQRMDIDVSGIEVEVGQEVEIIGENRSLMQYSKEIGMYPYELLTRFKHVDRSLFRYIGG